MQVPNIFLVVFRIEKTQPCGMNIWSSVVVVVVVFNTVFSHTICPDHSFPSSMSKSSTAPTASFPDPLSLHWSSVFYCCEKVLKEISLKEKQTIVAQDVITGSTFSGCGYHAHHENRRCHSDCYSMLTRKETNQQTNRDLGRYTPIMPTGTCFVQLDLLSLRFH